MTVGELVTELTGCDPGDMLVWEARSEALLVIGVRPGMHQEWAESEPLRLTAEDQSFLGVLRIRNY